MALYKKTKGKWVDALKAEKPTKIYGIRIDANDSDFRNRVIYTDDAVGMTGMWYNTPEGMGTWEGHPLVADIKPVLRRSNGTWQDLNKRNLASGANLTTLGNDVLVEIRTWWLSIKREGQYIYIRFANKKVDDTYHKYASTYRGRDVGCFHVGAYHTFVDGGKAYSVQGKVPTAGLSGETFTQYAQARGEGFDELDWNQITYLACLSFVLCRGTFKMGLASGYSDSVIAENNTQYTNDLGMIDSTGHNMSYLWMEAFWCNLLTCISGCYIENGHVFVQTDGEPSKYSGSGFTDGGAVASANTDACLADVVGTSTLSGMAPAKYENNIYFSTYFQCQGGTNARNLVYGGSINQVQNGPASVRFNRSSGQSAGYDGGRIVYRAGRPGVEPI